jgi:galactokinase
MNNKFENDELIQKVISKFETLHGNTEHVSIFTSPASIMILGDHTHYNEGILIPGRVDRYWVCAIRKRKDKTISFANCNSGKFISGCIDNQNIDDQREFKLLVDLTKNLCNKEIIKNGFDCVIDSNIPECFGLGKISSLQVTFVNGIKKIFGLKISDEDLLKMVYENEINFVGKISNRGHHYNIQYGKANKLLSYDLRNKNYEHVNFFPKKYELVVCDTESEIKNSNARCNERVEECEVGVKSLRLYIWGIKSLRDVNSDFLLRHFHMLPRKIFNRILYNVNERKRCQDALEYIKKNSWEDFGTLIKASHWSLSQDYEVSDEKVDFLVDTASNLNGVIASKMISCSAISSTFNIIESQYVDEFCKIISEQYRSKFQSELKIFKLNIVDGVKKVSIKN